MRTTLVLTVDDRIAEFLESQEGLIDPSALVNKLLHEEMDRHGKDNRGQAAASNRDEVSVALEEHLDENTHAAG